MVSTPEPPDPMETAQAQGGMNRDTAITQQLVNMVNQQGPTGSLNYSQSGNRTFVDANGKTVTVPAYTATTSLTPEQQSIFDKTQAAQGNIAGLAQQQSGFLKDYLGKAMDTSGLPALQGSIGGSFTDKLGDGYTTSYAGADDFSADRQKTEDALMARMDPYFQQDNDRLQSQLINSGIRPGSAAWDAEWARMSRGQNDARLGAVLAGGQEQSRLVGMARDAASFGNQSELARFGAQNTAAAQQAGFGNAARAQGLGEAYAARNQPLNEIGALLSGSQVAMPQFQQTPQASVAGVDYTGLVNNQYQAQLQAQQGMMGGLFGLAAAPFAFL